MAGQVERKPCCGFKSVWGPGDQGALTVLPNLGRCGSGPGGRRERIKEKERKGRGRRGGITSWTLSSPAFSDSGGHQETKGDFWVCTSEPVPGRAAEHPPSPAGEVGWGHPEASGWVWCPGLWGNRPVQHPHWGTGGEKGEASEGAPDGETWACPHPPVLT